MTTNLNNLFAYFPNGMVVRCSAVSVFEFSKDFLTLAIFIGSSDEPYVVKFEDAAGGKRAEKTFEQLLTSDGGKILVCG